MKKKPHKAFKKAKKSAKDRADEIGALYEEGKILVDQGDAKKREAKQALDSLLVDEGLHESERAYVTGDKYVVGQFERKSADVFSEEIFRDLYPKEYQMCMVTRKVFSPEVMEQLVKAKKIKKEHVLAAVQKGRSSKVTDIKLRDESP